MSSNSEFKFKAAMLKKGRALLSATFELLQPTNQGKIVRFIHHNHDQTVTDPNLCRSGAWLLSGWPWLQVQKYHKLSRAREDTARSTSLR